MDIYIKPARKAAVYGASYITAGDVCEVQADAAVAERVRKLKLIPTDDAVKARRKRKIYLVSVIDIIRAIEQSLPGHTINNVGETDTVVVYHARGMKESRILQIIKVGLMGLVFAVGASTAVMSFHNDAEIPKVFAAYHKMLTGEETDKPRVIQVSYIVGLAGGIIVFFNHIGGKKIKDDPSPIEIEMSDYDKTITASLVEFLSDERGGKQDGSA